MNRSRLKLSVLLVTVAVSGIARSYAVQSKSALFSKVDGSIAFTSNLLPDLPTNDSITEATAMVPGHDGCIYITGNIEATDTDTNSQTFATDEVGDRLGVQDIFLLKLNDDSSLAWSKRFGSPGSDSAQAIAVDRNGNIYVSASTGRDIGDVAAGATVFKYDAGGTRMWIKNFGSKVAGDTLNGIAVNEDSSEIIISGTIGARSTLHTDETRLEVSAAFILRVSTEDGGIIANTVGDLFDSSVGVVGNAVAVKLRNGTGKCFLAGASLVKSGSSKIHNGAIYSFSYPELIQLSKKQVVSQTEDAFVSVVTSVNNYSVFAVGIADVSRYSELDGRVVRFNASNLAIGWERSIETTTFPDQASIEAGMVSEAARDVAVDEYGNVYVLLEASGPVGSEDAQKKLKNKRPALIIYAPNGTMVHKVQSLATEPTGAQTLMVHNGTALVSGWTLDSRTLTTKVFVSGVALPSEVYGRNGEEYEPPRSTLEDIGDMDTPEDESSGKVGLIAGIAGGAVALLLAIAVTVAVAVRARSRNRQ